MIRTPRELTDNGSFISAPAWALRHLPILEEWQQLFNRQRLSHSRLRLEEAVPLVSEPPPATTPVTPATPPPTLPPVIEMPPQVSNQENIAGTATTPETHTENPEAPRSDPNNQEPITEIRLEEAVPLVSEPPPIVITPETPVTPPPTPEAELPASTPPSVAPPTFEDPTPATPILETESPPPAPMLPPVIDTPAEAFPNPEPEVMPTPPPPPTLPPVIEMPPQVSNQENVAGSATTPETHTDNSEASPSDKNNQEPITEHRPEEVAPPLDPAATTEPGK